jgi:hypothetical protein
MVVCCACSGCQAMCWWWPGHAAAAEQQQWLRLCAVATLDDRATIAVGILPDASQHRRRLGQPGWHSGSCCSWVPADTALRTLDLWVRWLLGCLVWMRAYHPAWGATLRQGAGLPGPYSTSRTLAAGALLLQECGGMVRLWTQWAQEGAASRGLVCQHTAAPAVAHHHRMATRHWCC